jgi:hypothetical protein
MLSGFNAFIKNIHFFEFDFAEFGAEVDRHLEISLKTIDPQEEDAFVTLLFTEIIRLLNEYLEFSLVGCLSIDFDLFLQILLDGLLGLKIFFSLGLEVSLILIEATKIVLLSALDDLKEWEPFHSI